MNGSSVKVSSLHRVTKRTFSMGLRRDSDNDETLITSATSYSVSSLTAASSSGSVFGDDGAGREHASGGGRERAILGCCTGRSPEIGLSDLFP